MKIAIIEIDYHPEVLKNMCNILDDTFMEITFYTTEKIYKQVNDEHVFEKFNWVYFSEDESLKAFFLYHKENINSSDIVFFNTLASNFRFFSAFEFTGKKILRVHNTNAYFSPANNYFPKWTLFYLFKDVSHIIRKTIFSLDWYYRKKFIETVDYFVFADEKLREYAIDEMLINKEKTLASIPLAHYSECYEKSKKTHEVVVTIPGAIDPRRKDYDMLYNALKIASPKFDAPVKIYFLGKANGKYANFVKRMFKSLESKSLFISFYKDRVPQSTFSSVLKSTDFLTLPLKIETRYTIYTERYGFTKISGGINDMIHYGKPCVLTSLYPLSNELKQVTGQYSSVNEFAEIMIDWVNNRKFVEYQKNVALSLKNYEKGQLKVKIEQIFSSITSEHN
ncbi:MAG: hypothetical protein P1U44_01005 [Vicingaceae bacterium]|nr:hypothetical protein [Vicingaceae bacterium]